MKIAQRVSLKDYNTFGIEAIARQFVQIRQEQDLEELFAQQVFEKEQLLFLGGGSNMLFVHDYEGLVVHMNMRGITHEIKEDGVVVLAKAGELWNDVVNYCVAHGFGGIENLSLIPGTAGAAPVQNIGAYGVELKDVFQSCKAFDIANGIFTTFDKNDCAFGYRESIFKGKYKGRYLITEINLLLSRQSEVNTRYGAIQEELERRRITSPTIRDVAEVVSAIRVEKLPDPSTIGNAGSFFKNPIVSVDTFNRLVSNFVDIVYFPFGQNQFKLAAGWLIEKCGWKGKTVGNTGTWKNQALVLVNHGNSTGLEIYELSEKIIESVQERFGITLEREVNVIA
ncbi:UDP-N-acetylmuramate dehydrogenase [Olivibacter ginsenosidimutans]|uniref:UDP-N-acetylenolpyruvoylglucosamine reductase n=1 Tax=Olivibacter ginsenosidimutans TaxID=1176537 RepID=A0ABP9AR09_9SPHI